ncbi:cyclic pyranopterin monophosphate synthase MoaC [Petrocella sp. FN5]|uniref:cyclic pyranopterin monophosphate synthase MoaC n=1 Tax=Petrocella sp. FN5 TaxID=3032002 RepID=UPI0023DCC029|nr:cyclic pyranopterin monophosphate synthase MoaC [Petrocella sp. FN5]MDF1616592.1 cyclic pyranopterin monophosphate synthase MoaC [Petrocella sp. FN5]
MGLTHFNENGRAHMVEVTDKSDTYRVAVAKGQIVMKPSTIEAIQSAGIKKGDVLNVAQVAGIMGAKKTSDVIPMCHPLMLTGVNLEFEIQEDRIIIIATVKTQGKTGVEMEALTAVSVAALTIYDMCKAMDKDMVIGQVRLMEKTGGKSGHYIRQVDE